MSIEPKRILTLAEKLKLVDAVAADLRKDPDKRVNAARAAHNRRKVEVWQAKKSAAERDAALGRPASPRDDSAHIVSEMRMYAAFQTSTRRFIVKALDFGLPRGDPMKRWDAQGSFFSTEPLTRLTRYAPIPQLRRQIANVPFTLASDTAALKLMYTCTAFDISMTGLDSFSAYRFLYERLFGAAARPWLVPVFCNCATSGKLSRQRRTELQNSVGMFDLWEDALFAPAPLFFPEWDGD